MKKKILNTIVCAFLFVFSFALSANAVIMYDSDIVTASKKLESLANYDMLSLINTSEVIGDRKDSFKLLTFQYQRSAAATCNELRNILNRIDVLRNSYDISNTDRDMQINQLYQEADAAIARVVSNTMTYIIELQPVMPSITYKKYVNKFKKYYDNLQLSKQQLQVYY